MDRFPTITFAFIVLLLVLSVLDAVITIHLLDRGYHEINPLMGGLLKSGPLSFLLGKYVLTAAGIPLLVVFKNYYLFGTRFRVGYLVPLFVTMYLVLLGYQVHLLQNQLGPL